MPLDQRSDIRWPSPTDSPSRSTRRARSISAAGRRSTGLDVTFDVVEYRAGDAWNERWYCPGADQVLDGRS